MDDMQAADAGSLHYYTICSALNTNTVMLLGSYAHFCYGLIAHPALFHLKYIHSYCITNSAHTCCQYQSNIYSSKCFGIMPIAFNTRTVKSKL